MREFANSGEGEGEFEPQLLDLPSYPVGVFPLVVRLATI